MPVLTDKTNENAYECVKKVVEILSWRVSVWIILCDNLIVSINFSLVFEKFYSQEAEHKDYDQKQHEKSYNIFQSLPNFNNHFMESCPFSEESKYSQQPESSEYCQTNSFLVLTFFIVQILSQLVLFILQNDL